MNTLWNLHTPSVAQKHYEAFQLEAEAARRRADAHRLEGNDALAQHFDRQADLYAGNAKPFAPFGTDASDLADFAEKLATCAICKGNQHIDLIALERVAAQDRAEAARRLVA